MQIMNKYHEPILWICDHVFEWQFANLEHFMHGTLEDVTTRWSMIHLKLWIDVQAQCLLESTSFNS